MPLEPIAITANLVIYEEDDEKKFEKILICSYEKNIGLKIERFLFDKNFQASI